MPVISGRTTVPFGQSNTNLLAGSQYEFAPFDGTIEIGMLADKNLVTCAIFSGPDTLQEPGGLVPFTSTTDTPPRYPDDYHWEDEVAMGDRLKIAIFNGNAANTVINWVIRMAPA